MTFDLNKIPTGEDEEVPVVKQEMVEEVTTERPSAPENDSQGNRTGTEETPLIGGAWQALSAADLLSLYNMVQVPENYHRVHHVITQRPNGTSEHAWISWLPVHHSSPGGTVRHFSEWLTLPSIFQVIPPLAARPIASRPPGRPPPDIPSAFFDPRRLWSHGGLTGLQQAASQTTTDAEIEHHCDTEQSESRGDRFAPAFDHRNNMRTKKSMMETRSSVRLEELESNSEHGTNGVPTPVGVPTPLRSAQNQQHIGSSSQQGAENHDEAEQVHSESELLGAELLDHLAKEERRKMREAAFLAEFNFTTERCKPTAPCSRCLQFCKAPLPQHLADSIGPTSLGALYGDDDCPPVLKNMDEEEAALRKGARHGPKSKSSQYRGVTFYKRTGRWESHIWHEAAQVYLGASATKELAARAYDKAAIMLGGPDVDINFEPESYQKEMSYLYKLNKEQLVIYLRRDSRGFGAQAAYPGVKHVKNHYQAICGQTLLGTFPTEDGAARALYNAAVKDSFATLASLIIDTHHVRNMPSFAAQRFAALYPETVETMMLNNQARASKKGSKSPSQSTKKYSSPLARKRLNAEYSPVTPSATASPDPVEQLPGSQIDENDSPAAKRSRRTWGQHLAPRRAQQHSWQTRAAQAARKPPATSVMPPASSSRPTCNTASPGVGVSRISPWPVTVRESHLGSCSSWPATVLSPFSGIGQTSTPPSVPTCPVASSSGEKRPMNSDTVGAPPGFVKFRLFNRDIIVAEEKAALEHGGHGGHSNVNPPEAQNLNGVAAGVGLYSPPSVTEEDRCNRLVLPRERCRTIGEPNPEPNQYLQNALAAQIASDLNSVVAINKRLHEILTQTVPQAPRTRLTIEQPDVRNARVANRHRHGGPYCRCHLQLND